METDIGRSRLKIDIRDRTSGSCWPVIHLVVLPMITQERNRG